VFIKSNPDVSGRRPTHGAVETFQVHRMIIGRGGTMLKVHKREEPLIWPTAAPSLIPTYVTNSPKWLLSAGLCTGGVSPRTGYHP
jgi:hypothetical protein